MEVNPAIQEIALLMGKTIGSLIVTREILTQRGEDTTKIQEGIDKTLDQLKRTIALGFKETAN